MPAGREQRVADDQPGADALVDVVAEPAVVVREPVQREVAHERIEPDGDARRPLEARGVDLAGDRVGAGHRELEGRADLLALALDVGSRGALDARHQIVDLEDLDVRADLRLDLREVGVHVEHAGVVVAEEAEARAPHAVRRGGGLDPAAQAIPGRIAREQRARDGVVRDACARERAGELRHAAGRAVREPLARRHRLVVEAARRLQVEDHDRHLRGLHRRQHLRGRRVGRRVEHDDVDAAGGEQVARLARALGGVDETGRDDIGAELGEPPLDVALVAEQPLVQALELRPVGGQADAQEPDARARALTPRRRHDALLPRRRAAARLARRAAALSMRVRARR